MLKKILTLVAALLLWGGVATARAEVLKLDFESGTLPQGWSTASTAFKKDNGSNRLSFPAAATLTSAPVTGVTSVSFDHRGSGNGKVMKVEASQDGGSTWRALGQATVSSSSTYGNSSFSAGGDPSLPTIIRLTAQSGTIYIDNLTVNYISLAQEPTEQCIVTGGEATGSTLTATLTPGNGSGRLVAITEGCEVPAWTPTDGNAWTGNFPKKLAEAGLTLLASGDVTTVSATGLKPGTDYTLAAWEYTGGGESINYLTSTTAAATVSTATVPTFAFTPAKVNFSNTRTGGERVAQVTLEGKYLDPHPRDTQVTVQMTSGDGGAFDLSADGGRDWAGVLAIPVAEGQTTLNATFTVRFRPTAKQTYTATLTAEGAGAAASLAVSGTGADNDSHTYFIAPDGDDTQGDGTIDNPWMNLQLAVNKAQPGDIIYCRGGRYHFTTRDSSGKLTVRLKSSGAEGAPITISAWEGEHPVFDFEQQLLDCGGDRSKVGDRGMLITGNYWHLYGLHITHAADNGIKLEGSHCRIERCEFSHCLDTGLQLGFGHDFSATGFGSKNDGSYCAWNDIIDCDSHHNCDYDTNYGADADGFACKMHNGEGNRFIRCRAWRNGDDAWDLFETDYSVTLIECWAWESAKAADHEWVWEYFPKGLNFSGNGNGIKLGGNGSGGSSKGVHYAWNCIAWGCNKTSSVKGFDCNNHKGGHVIVGGLAWDNGYDYMFDSSCDPSSRFHNNVCLGRQEVAVGIESHNAMGSQSPQAGKTWTNGVLTGITRDDFVSLDEADALAPRGEDGSMPQRFARLRPGSRLVDAGTDMAAPDVVGDYPWLWQPVYGGGRDIGPYELEEGEKQSSAQLLLAPGQEGDRLEVRPSGRGRELTATVCVSRPCAALSLIVTDMAGRRVGEVPLGALEPGGNYTVPVAMDGVAPGIYLLTAPFATGPVTVKVRH